MDKLAKYSKSAAAVVSSLVVFGVSHAFISDADGRTLTDAIGVLLNFLAVWVAPKNKS